MKVLISSLNLSVKWLFYLVKYVLNILNVLHYLNKGIKLHVPWLSALQSSLLEAFN